MRIGDLRHRVTIQRPVPGRDERNQAITSWSDVGIVWAAVEAVAGNESRAAEHDVGTVGYRVTIRHRAGITPAMRVLHAGRVLGVKAVLDRDGRRRWLELICEEVT